VTVAQAGVAGRWRAYGTFSVVPTPGEPVVRADRVSVRYEGQTAAAVDDVSFEIQHGECVLLLGDNGAGKSTLLKSIASLLTPASGTLKVFGLPLGWCRAAVSYVPQRGELDWEFPIDVRGLVASGRHVHRGWFGRLRTEDRARIDDAIDRLGLRAIARTQIGRLSGGQQQRTLVARALVQDAELLLVDEPTNSMDATSIATLTDVLANVTRAGRTIVISTHDAARFRSIATRSIRLACGRIVSDERHA
jgi:ABC-type Mn2+/Zn2+ transport system ATPase subunit